MKVKDEAIEILDIAKRIYQIQESNNPDAIFKDKIFLVGTENNREVISVKRNYEEKDSSYYFESSEIAGVIIKRENNSYCIKARVKYTNAKNESLWFAKIRIEYCEDIQVMGTWCGSWQKPDYEDEDQIKNPNSDFFLALVAMKTHLADMYNFLCNNKELSGTFDHEYFRKLKKYNN